MTTPPPDYDPSLSAEVTDALDLIRVVAQVEQTRHVWKDGEYRGCLITYSNPLHSDIKTVFHPYFPLIEFGKPSPKMTRDYFIARGLPVPGEGGSG